MERPLSQTVKDVLTSLASPQTQKRSNLMNQWPLIAGPALSKRTTPRFSSDSCVVVWVDDSTLAFELSRRYKPVLLKRLQNQFGEGDVKDIKFLVGAAR